jgi:hypothetical protein
MLRRKGMKKKICALMVRVAVCGAALFAQTEAGDEQASVTHGRAI